MVRSNRLQLINSLKEELIKIKQQLSNITDNSEATDEDINIVRLRKAYQNLVTKKKKQEDTYKKDLSKLEKSLREAQEDLKLSTKKQKDSEEEKKTVVHCNVL